MVLVGALAIGSGLRKVSGGIVFGVVVAIVADRAAGL